MLDELFNEKKKWWCGLKAVFSERFQAEMYSCTREGLIQLAYHADGNDRGGSEESAAAIDEIYAYEDSLDCEKNFIEGMNQVAELRNRFASSLHAQDPARRSSSLDKFIRVLYGLNDDDEYLSGSHSLAQVTNRYHEVLAANGTAWQKEMGDPAVVRYIITYDFYIRVHHQRCQAIQQLLDEGMIDKSKLSINGRNHDAVTRDVEAFDRDLLRRWEVDLKVRNAEEKKLAYRIFLRDRSRTWHEGYARWRDASIKC